MSIPVHLTFDISQPAHRAELRAILDGIEALLAMRDPVPRVATADTVADDLRALKARADE